MSDLPNDELIAAARDLVEFDSTPRRGIVAIVGDGESAMLGEVVAHAKPPASSRTVAHFEVSAWGSSIVTPHEWRLALDAAPVAQLRVARARSSCLGARRRPRTRRTARSAGGGSSGDPDEPEPALGRSNSAAGAEL